MKPPPPPPPDVPLPPPPPTIAYSTESGGGNTENVTPSRIVAPIIDIAMLFPITYLSKKGSEEPLFI
jgi:hypothetical protein